MNQRGEHLRELEGRRRGGKASRRGKGSGGGTKKVERRSNRRGMQGQGRGWGREWSPRRNRGKLTKIAHVRGPRKVVCKQLTGNWRNCWQGWSTS
jgi:hypothetical protein